MNADLLHAIRDGLRGAADPERAQSMQAYMKSAMPFRGVRVPDARKIARAAAKAHPLETIPDLQSAVTTLWDEAEFREERYAASEITKLRLAKGQLALVPLFEHMATTGAWWDHVDDVAHRIADLHDAHPVETARIVLHWSRSDDMWLRRLAIISQLGRGDRVDKALLTAVIEPNIESKEFFIRKAIGWALRQHAKDDPDWVLAFVAAREDQLSGLSRREALKHVG